MMRALQIWCLFAVLLAGCNSFRVKDPEPVVKFEPPTPNLPAKKSFRVSQFLFWHDFELRSNLPVFTELDQLRERVLKDLQLPASNSLVQVYLFEDKDRYERYMKAKYPGLPERRAFFVAQPRSVDGGEDLLVFTYWGDRVQQDLRHELTHALLHSVLKGVPLWLDEGLAEYYEVPAAWRGINYPHLDQLRQGFTPNLARLEQLGDVQQMNSAEYRESWAWVHLMLQGPPEGKKVLLDYLRQLRTNPHPDPLSPRLAEALTTPDKLVVEHVNQMQTRHPLPATARQSKQND